MDSQQRVYNIAVAVFSSIAAIVCVFVWFHFPFSSNIWPSIFCFSAFLAIAILLSVDTQSNQLSIVPSSPVVWLAACVLSPTSSVIACCSGTLVGNLITIICFHVVHALTGQIASEYVKSPRKKANDWRESILRYIALVSCNWHTCGLWFVIKGLVFNISIIAINVGLSGVAYYYLGGKFLINYQVDSVVSNFILPFLGIVLVSSTIDSGLHVILTTNMDPIPGSKRLYAVILRAKMVVIEDVMPVMKGELFLVVVTLLLGYLYIYIGLWGFLFAVLPVVALRDFFNQWVQERSAYTDTITTLATYMQHYHPYTRGHLKRVADMSERLARELKLSVESVIYMRTAAFVHDIGKIGVSEEILDKTSKLTDEEWERIREHPVKGAEIISHLEFLEGMVDWIKYHHKWYNGAGYPANGEVEIPIEASIIAVADAFDAMTDDREMSLRWKCDSCAHEPTDGSRPKACPICGAEKRRTYREPKPMDEAIDELRRGSGTQFDPKVIKAFLVMVVRDGIKLDV